MKPANTVRRLIHHLGYRLRAARESKSVGRVAIQEYHRFCVISTERDAGESAVRCLQSVYDQDYPRHAIRHVFIDDNSSGSTLEQINRWRDNHGDANLEITVNHERRGATVNFIRTLQMTRHGEIVVDLNGDDWLPDTGVLSFLNRLYQDFNVWMTFNTCIERNGRIWVSPSVLDSIHNSPRSPRERVWFLGHLRTFRRDLLNSVDIDQFVDNESNRYFSSADDMALYFSLYELSGQHARHVYRTTYFYNRRPESHFHREREKQRENESKIRSKKALAPIDKIQEEPGPNSILGADLTIGEN